MALLAQNPVPVFAGNDGRAIGRRSMLVAATLRVGAQALAVRIRNMSETGALIEGGVLPSPNDPVEIVRGSLRATGRVAWVHGSRCGVALDGRVAVDSWMAGATAPHQARLDARIDAARRAIASGLRPSPDPLAEVVPPGARPGAAAGPEIDAIIASLARLGERLADDPQIIAGHMIELQVIDEAQQRLAALKRRLA